MEFTLPLNEKEVDEHIVEISDQLWAEEYGIGFNCIDTNIFNFEFSENIGLLSCTKK